MLDRQTEIIAHFIGAFNQTTETNVARQEYDAFRALQASTPTPGELLSVNVSISSNYALEDFGPAIWLKLPLAPPSGAPWLPFVDDFQLRDIAPPGLPPGQFAIPPYEFPPVPIPPQMFLGMTPPSSVLHITSQINMLTDHDVLYDKPFMMPAGLMDEYGPEATSSKLMALADYADALTVSTAPVGTTIEAQTETLIAQIDALDPESVPGGATAAMFRSETIFAAPTDAEEEDGLEEGAADPAAMTELQSESLEGDEAEATSPLPPAFSGEVVFDGQLMNEMPETLKLRLEARDPSEDEEDDAPLGEGVVEVETDGIGGDGDGAAGLVQSPDMPVDPAGLALEIVQSLSTGNNLLLNQSQSVHDWLDAPVIAVGGSMTSLSVISQVNVLRDADMKPGLGHHGTGNSAGGKGLGNAEGYDPLASQAHNVAVYTQEANPANFLDLVMPPGASMIAMTEIRGDLIIDNHTTQVNAVSDGDLVSYEFGSFSSEIVMGDNSTVNLQLLLEIGTHFDLIMIGGNMYEIAQLEQINVLLDDDLVMSGSGGVGQGGAGHVSSEDNLLWNEAHLTKVGIDQHMEMDEQYQNVLDQLSEIYGGLDPNPGEGYSMPPGAAFDAVEGLLGDELLGGQMALRVLYIEGDLIIRDNLTQINILEDADLISLDGPGEFDIEAGGNTLGNVGSLTVAGVDSTIMAADGVYSDAVIWQAGMMDDGSGDPLGPTSSSEGALASEAVAFLADGMIENAPSYDDEEFQVHPGSQGGSGSLDALHTVLA
ncbi:hypothetical protein AXZ77_0357 [Thioclava sp. ES.031]|uniref:hypothetical protein n=1 Tax=Thioclava sp. ES.031 TaxID=1798203 RepID=UPI000BF28D67|nr:hypothetical protein [Thioclava sp. ES.031]PFG61795.1 hypothetical protein AXZ77_0357 [Thioclava sp. ES.031]